MNRALKRNLAYVAAAAIVLLGGRFVWEWNSSHEEVTAGAYEGLAEAWPRLSPPIKEKLRAAMQDGKLTDGEFKPLIDPIMKDAQMLTASIPADQSEKGQEQHLTLMREKFIATVRNP